MASHALVTVYKLYWRDHHCSVKRLLFKCFDYGGEGRSPTHHSKMSHRCSDVLSPDDFDDWRLQYIIHVMYILIKPFSAPHGSLCLCYVSIPILSRSMRLNEPKSMMRLCPSRQFHSCSFHLQTNGIEYQILVIDRQTWGWTCVSPAGDRQSSCIINPVCCEDLLPLWGCVFGTLRYQ